jgi:hypothetical protein
MVSWSLTRCFSANVSAASLFENVATTGPLASPRLTSNLAPSWVTTYVLMPSVWHGPSHAPSGTVYESFSAIQTDPLRWCFILPSIPVTRQSGRRASPNISTPWARRCGRASGDRLEAPSPSDHVHGGQKLAHGSRQPVEPGDDQHITLAGASCGQSVRVPLFDSSNTRSHPRA